jgi:hypothetical protein
LVVSAGEAVYFGGFLLGSTAHLGLWSYAIVPLGQALAAAVRGMPLRQGILGAYALVAMIAWSGNSYLGVLVHLGWLATPVDPQPPPGSRRSPVGSQNPSCAPDPPRRTKGTYAASRQA